MWKALRDLFASFISVFKPSDGTLKSPRSHRHRSLRSHGSRRVSYEDYLQSLSPPAGPLFSETLPLLLTTELLRARYSLLEHTVDLDQGTSRPRSSPYQGTETGHKTALSSDLESLEGHVNHEVPSTGFPPTVKPDSACTPPDSSALDCSNDIDDCTDQPLCSFEEFERRGVVEDRRGERSRGFVTVAMWADPRTLLGVGFGPGMPPYWVDDQGDPVAVQFEDADETPLAYMYPTWAPYARLPGLEVDSSGPRSTVRRGAHGVDDDQGSLSSESSFGSPPGVLSPSQVYWPTYFPPAPAVVPVAPSLDHGCFDSRSKRYVYGTALDTVAEEDLHDSGIEYSDEASPQSPHAELSKVTGFPHMFVSRTSLSSSSTEYGPASIAETKYGYHSAASVESNLDHLQGDDAWSEGSLYATDPDSNEASEESDGEEEGKTVLTVEDFAELADLWDARVQHVIGMAKLAPATQVCFEIMCATSDAARKNRNSLRNAHRTSALSILPIPHWTAPTYPVWHDEAYLTPPATPVPFE